MSQLQLDDDNQKRLIAADVIRQLCLNGNISQLRLLRIQLKASIDQILMEHAKLCFSRNGNPHEDDWELAKSAKIIADEWFHERSK